MILKIRLFCVLVVINSAWAITDYYEKSNSYVDYEALMRQKILTDLDELKSSLRNLQRRLDDKEAVEDLKNKELPLFDIRYDTVPERCQTNYTPSNCEEATACTKRSGFYEIQISRYGSDPFLVKCDAKTEGGGWTVLLTRQDGSENFYRDWSEFKEGFGDIQGEFFIGLEKLYALTNFLGQQELLVVMEDLGEGKYARYSSFAIADEALHYELRSLGKYSGTAGDSLLPHVGMKFTTKDRDNDLDAANCAQTYNGAWWHKKCHASNLMGKYGNDVFGKGVNWHTFKGYTRSLQFVKMMTRRRRE